MKTYTHDPIGRPPISRVCEYDTEKGIWIIKSSALSASQVGEECLMDHWMIEAQDEPDRGDFGMPTIGGGYVTGVEPGELTTGYATTPGKLYRLPGAGPDWNVTLSSDGMSVVFGDENEGHGYNVPATTPEAKYIMEILPEIIAEFLNKNAQYARAQSGHDLGLKGIIPDINRKTSAIISRVWDDQPLMPGQDSTEELIDDCIGHLLLMRAKIKES